MLRIALGALSSAGFLISLYFTLVNYRVIAADPGFLPRFCRLAEGSCRVILDAPQARLFGVPNSLLGMVYYALIMFLAFNVWIAVPLAIAKWMFVASLVASAVGLTLAETLLRRLKTPCALCFTSHAINLGISVMLYLNL